MENASKALIIAGGILIGIIVLSIGVFLYLRMSVVKKQYDEDKAVSELAKFNTEFTVFEGREDIRAYEIVSLNNFVEKYNSKQSDSNQITLTVFESNSTTQITVNDNFLKNNSTNGSGSSTSIAYFKCKDNPTQNIKAIGYNENGRVKTITFVKVP